MWVMNLQLFSGGGAGFNQRGGGGKVDKDAVDEDLEQFRFYYIDENGNQRIKDINARDIEQAKKYWNEIKEALKAKKVVKAGRIIEKAASNVTSIEKSIIDPGSGEEIDLSGSRLQYTSGPESMGDDNLNRVKTLAKDIRDKTNENLTVFDRNNKVIYNKEGTINNVSAPSEVMQQAKYDMHNHTRGTGLLGGTFSVVDSEGKGDMQSFVKHDNLETSFASAKEGIYYISKGSDFKGKRFLNHMRSTESKIMKKMNSDLKQLESKRDTGRISYDTYLNQFRKIQNNALSKLHNEYLKGQKKYGYTYGLFKD